MLFVGGIAPFSFAGDGRFTRPFHNGDDATCAFSERAKGRRPDHESRPGESWDAWEKA